MEFNLQIFGGRGSGSGKNYLNFNKQGKHWIWHKNYIQGRSPVNLSPKELQKLVSKSNKGHGQRETLDFGQPIGKWYNIQDGKYYETTRGTFHWSKDGGYHLVPAPPSWWFNNK